MIIYCIENKQNGKKYIGQTTSSLEDRVKQHFKCKFNRPLNNALRKYGKEAFTFNVLFECNSIEQLNEKEVYFINMFNSLTPKGYNIKSGGKGGGKHSNETKFKMSLLKIGKASWSKGLTKETDFRIRSRSEKLKGLAKSKEHIENMRIANKGKKNNSTSERNKLKIGALNPISKKYKITKPDGSSFEIYGLTLFCKCNNLNQSALREVAKGKRKHHKYYKCELLEGDVL